MVTIKANFSSFFNRLSFLSWDIVKEFKLDQNKKTSKFYRYINEIPTLMLILIVFIVIFKPI